MLGTPKVSAMSLWKCIICGLEAKETPPRRCSSCGTPAAKFRLVCDRKPVPPPEKPAPEPEVADEDSAAPEAIEAPKDAPSTTPKTAEPTGSED
jgi:hypothetical protein